MSGFKLSDGSCLYSVRMLKNLPPQQKHKISLSIFKSKRCAGFLVKSMFI